ncbi:FGGY-family carbohydrate kinase [Rhodobacter sp. KR11]|uniref:FGGY-family carbohydrate kinase n=1 Tax=Rhodobacter sp. KR11 TaxID=2974588 RepID=UPI0022232A93|nr:FGGY-family carbohydrate kinase [Rhodobacter sp. KR11]MCW1920338.1 FGGY-family carbohydrate kinase [Rhodobacter sp. KR11]
MLIGVDVGTGSARAGVFSADGKMLGVGKHPLTLWHEAGEIVEQSSAQIWEAVCIAVGQAMQGLDPSGVKGVGFDATCSLVAEGVSVSPSEDPLRDVILWMDHRASPEAEEINRGGYAVLDYVGGRISPEMETPKLLWLSRHRPEAFAGARRFWDLPDWLTFKATGSEKRSSCTVTCKWTYLAHEDRWDEGYFRAIGLGALADEGFRRIGTQIVAPGTPLGGLTAQAARDLGLCEGTPVAAALIDAHAGGLGTLGVTLPGSADPTRRLAYIFGTSACSMASTHQATPVPGVWGPYYNAMLPGLWLNEGGQSAAGEALAHLIHLHRDAGPGIAQVAAHAETLGATLSETILAAAEVVVVPEFLGNRSPFAEPDARAVISGLGLDRGIDTLAALYLGGLSGIGYGLKQLLDRFDAKGIAIDTIVASGGAAQSRLACQMLADTTGRQVALPGGQEPVLLGAAMLAAPAGGVHHDLAAAMAAMSGDAVIFAPATGKVADLHALRFTAFEALQLAARTLRAARKA